MEPEELRHIGTVTLSRFVRTSKRFFCDLWWSVWGCALARSIFVLRDGQLKVIHPKQQQQQQQQQRRRRRRRRPFYGPLSGTTQVSRYQKKHSPIHHPDHHPIFISFFHLPQSIAYSLFKLRAWQSFCTTFFHVPFGLPLGLEPSTSYSKGKGKGKGKVWWYVRMVLHRSGWLYHLCRKWSAAWYIVMLLASNTVWSRCGTKVPRDGHPAECRCDLSSVGVACRM